MTPLDLVVVAAYFAATMAVGFAVTRRSRSVDGFTTAGRSLPGWVVGLSIFGTFLSSIGFLALPGKALVSNWSPFAFSLALPIAAWMAARFFVPFYRTAGHVSAYRHLEDRFGVWARVYASLCYLLTQVARMGSILYLLAIPLEQLLGWDIRAIILATGAATIVYTCRAESKGHLDRCGAERDPHRRRPRGGGAPRGRLPEGPSQLFRIGVEHGKFSLGDFGASLSEPTFWVILFTGLFINLQNFGIDQNFVQRYTSRSQRDATRSGRVLARRAPLHPRLRPLLLHRNGALRLLYGATRAAPRGDPRRAGGRQGRLRLPLLHRRPPSPRVARVS